MRYLPVALLLVVTLGCGMVDTAEPGETGCGGNIVYDAEFYVSYPLEDYAAPFYGHVTVNETCDGYWAHSWSDRPHFHFNVTGYGSGVPVNVTLGAVDDRELIDENTHCYVEQLDDGGSVVSCGMLKRDLDVEIVTVGEMGLGWI